MKYHVLFSLEKDKSKNIKCYLLQFLFSPLRAKFSIAKKVYETKKI